MSKTLAKLDNLSKTVRTMLKMSFASVHASAQRTKSFVEIKPEPVAKHNSTRRNLTILSEHTLAVGSTYK